MSMRSGAIDYWCNAFTEDRRALWDAALEEQGLAVRVRRDPEDGFADAGRMVARMDELGIDTLLLPAADLPETAERFAYERYASRFEEVTKKQARRDEIVHGTLNVVGPEIERDLTAIMKSAFDDGDAEAAYSAGITLRSLMLARLYANRFLIQNDDASFQRVGKEFLRMEEDIDELFARLEDPERIARAEEVRDAPDVARPREDHPHALFFRPLHRALDLPDLAGVHDDGERAVEHREHRLERWIHVVRRTSVLHRIARLRVGSGIAKDLANLLQILIATFDLILARRRLAKER